MQLGKNTYIHIYLYIYIYILVGGGLLIFGRKDYAFNVWEKGLSRQK